MMPCPANSANCVFIVIPIVRPAGNTAIPRICRHTPMFVRCRPGLQQWLRTRRKNLLLTCKEAKRLLQASSVELSANELFPDARRVQSDEGETANIWQPFDLHPSCALLSVA